MENDIETLKDEIEALKKENDLKTGWISLLSHDLKENFSSLLWLIEAVESERLSKDDFFKFLPQIKTDTSKNLQSVIDTGDWLKTQYGNFSSQLNPYNIFELFSELKEEHQKILKAKNIALQFRGDKNLQIFTDKFLFRIIFSKIIDNAVKYSHPDQVINFEVVERPSKVVFSVEDFGIGMSEKSLESIFSFPSSVFKGTNGEIGAGLSLKIVKYFVILLQGEIQIAAVENKGTTVSISLPQIDK